MNEDLKNKIERLRGLLSTQGQMSEVPMAPVPPMGMEDMMSNDPIRDESGDVMRPACIRRLIENDGKGPAVCPPPEEDGCCCDGGIPTGMTMESECDGVWQGAGVSCQPNPCGGMSIQPPTIKEIFHRGLQALKEEYEMMSDESGMSDPTDQMMG